MGCVSDSSTLPIVTTEMEVYDLTGAREMLTLEKAKEIAQTIFDNAKTLKRVVLGTKTYKADVAKVVAGRRSSRPFPPRCPLPGNGIGRVGSGRYDFRPFLRRGAGHLRGVRGLSEAPASEVSGFEQQRTRSQGSRVLQGADFGGRCFPVCDNRATRTWKCCCSTRTACLPMPARTSALWCASTLPWASSVWSSTTT